MKVIVAGLAKTGTVSMVAALQELDMKVYHYAEHYQYAGDDWINIMKNGGTTEDFRRMYKGVDAVSDEPAAYFWEELLKAFPDAKVILTMRDNEDIWIRSLKKQQETFNTPTFTLLRYLSPSYYKYYWSYAHLLGLVVYGAMENSPICQGHLNETLCKIAYRRHNTHVMQTAPKNKLLVYNVKEGWEPLCKFLGVDVPSKPFPHKNVRGSITQDLMDTNPLAIRMQREMYVSLALLTILLSYGCYKAAKSSPLSWFESMTNLSMQVFDRISFWN